MHVHHLELAPGAHGFAAVVDLQSLGAVDWGGEAMTMVRGPNLYLLVPTATGGATRPRPVNAPGLAHLCLQARDGERAQGALEAADVRFVSAPVSLGTGFRYAYAHDRAGRLLELESAPFLPTAPPAWFGHFAFVSPDAERLAAFYAALLGAEMAAGGRIRGNPRVDAVAGLDGVDVSVWWVRAAHFTLEFWRYHAPTHDGRPAPDGYGALGLETDDLDGAVADALAGGATLEGRRHGSDGDAATLRDPDGNRLRLVAPARPGHGARELPHRDILARAAAAREAA